MKKFVCIFVVLLVVLSSCTSYFTEKKLSKFADPKEAYAMLLQGEVVHNTDTIKFNLIPAVQFPLDRYEKDEIVIISENRKAKFNRTMTSWHSVPNPSQNGKSMNSWKFKSGSGENALSKKESLEIFEKVVNNGNIIYNGFRTNKQLETNFGSTYKKDPKEAKRLARVVSNPIFSKRKI